VLLGYSNIRVGCSVHNLGKTKGVQGGNKYIKGTGGKYGIQTNAHGLNIISEDLTKPSKEEILPRT